VNPNDPYTRIAALWLDRQPPSNWTESVATQATANHKEFITNAKDTLVEYTPDISDGQHNLYLGVSQDEKSKLGVWSGTASIGGVIRSFDKVDYDTFAKFDFNVKDGKVLDSTKPNGKVTPPTQVKTFKQKVSELFVWPEAFPPKDTREWISNHKVLLLLLSAGSGAAVGYGIWRKKKRRY
jgi:hypothetical protein